MQSQIIVESMQWNTLSHIADISPIGESDAACLEEVRQVLLRHGQVERFGISLLHSHFNLAADEMLLETTDMQKREHWVRPVKKSFLAENGITAQSTVIGFNEMGYQQICGCNPRASGHFHL